jgi:hypothetical protein
MGKTNSVEIVSMKSVMKARHPVPKRKPAGGAPVTATGGCLCGAVRYKVKGPLRGVVHCHCGQCRRWHGHVGAYTTVALAHFSATGDRYLKWFRSSKIASRGFCARCGSSLLWKRHGADNIGIAAGTLNAPTRLKSVRHIFVAHRGDYYRITDRLERLPGTMAAG